MGIQPLNVFWEAPWLTVDPTDNRLSELERVYGEAGNGRFFAGFTGHALCPTSVCAVKGAAQQWVRVPPGNWIAPPGNNQSSGGSDEAAEASGAEGLIRLCLVS